MTWVSRKLKYKNVKTSRDGVSFASKAEAGLFDYLCLRQSAGEISYVLPQVSVYLTDARIQYICDFSYILSESGDIEYAEMKGFDTPVWRIKRRLWMHYGPGNLLVFSAKMTLREVIKPKRLGV